MKRIITSVFIVFASVLLSACGWFGSKDNTTPPAPLVQFKPSLNVTPLWSTQVGSGSKKYYLKLTPAVANNKVYATDYNGRVTALDRASGRMIWQIKIGTDLTSGVAVDGSQLFIGTEDGQVIALSQKDGSQQWKTPVGSEILAAPVTAHGMVLVKSMDGVLTALSEKDGRQLWHFEQDVPSLILHICSQPQIAGSYVVAGFANGKLAVINLKSGKPLWVRPIAEPVGTTDIERMVDIDISPVVVDGVIYVATYQGEIAALDLKTGQIIWRHKVSAYAGMTADSDRIYLSDAKSHVWAFDEDEGTVLWRQSKLNARMITGPALMGRYVVVADAEGYLHWMSRRDGHFVARSYIGGNGVLADPVTIGHTVYTYSRDGMLSAFKIK